MFKQFLIHQEQAGELLFVELFMLNALYAHW